MGTTDKLPDNPDSVASQLQRPELRAQLITLATRKGIPAADREDIASTVIEEAIRCQAEFNPTPRIFPLVDYGDR